MLMNMLDRPLILSTIYSIFYAFGMKMLLPLRFNNKSSVIQTNFVAYKERKKYVTNVLPHTPNSEWMSVVAHKPHIFFFLYAIESV